MIGMIYGLLIQKYNIFPYYYIKNLYSYFRGANSDSDSYGLWSIGIYSGTTPFVLEDLSEISNPVLTGNDVDDIDAEFVADPFIVGSNDQYYMFFEVMNRKTKQGDIGYAKSDNGLTWKYSGIVLDESFHLSYPYVFENKGNYYLIPSSGNDLSVRLYVASPFPEKWQYVGNLLSGHHYIDPSIVNYDDRWWLFASVPSSDSLNLFYSDELREGWTSHPMNPIIKSNKNISRPGGRVVVHNNRVYRLTQDDHPYYGIQVFCYEITNLSTSSYKEHLHMEKPVVSKTGRGWNSSGMHHVDPHKIGERWIVAVDGRK